MYARRRRDGRLAVEWLLSMILPPFLKMRNLSATKRKSGIIFSLSAVTSTAIPLTHPLLARCLGSRNPYLLDVWTKYLAFKKRARPRVRYLIYERALK
jgi:hypothetical protein